MPTINVANLVAYVGANLTDFNLGMRNVDAGLHQVEARSAKTEQRLSSMAQTASRYTAAADVIARQRAQALSSGTAYSRQADVLRQRRNAIETGHSEFDRKIAALQSRQSGLDISPLIRDLRVADAELTNAVHRQQKLKTEFQQNVNAATKLAVQESVGAATKQLEHQTDLFNAAQFKLREAEAKLNIAKATPHQAGVTAAEKELQAALQKHSLVDKRLSKANARVNEIQYYDPLKQTGINPALRAAENAELAHLASEKKVTEAQKNLINARKNVNQKSVDSAAKQLEGASSHFAAAEIKLREAEQKVQAASVIGIQKGTAAVNAELNAATKAYTEAQEKFRRAQASIDAHVTTAGDLHAEEQNVRQAAQREIDNLRRQEAEKRNQHTSYIGNLASRERTYRERATATTDKIEPARAEAEATLEAQRTRIAMQAQHAQEARNGAMGAIGNAMIIGGAAVETALLGATKVGADYNQQMLIAQHNTVMTAEGMEIMRKTVAKLGLESGADLKSLTDGFRLIQDFGFGAAKSAELLNIAMRASVATGADLTVTSELLGKAVKEFNMPVDQAGKAMAVMVEAANRSRLTMDQMVHVGGQLYATASNLGLSFVETNAALVTFTKHGLSGSEAAVQLKNDIQKIIAPSKAVRDVLADLDRRYSKKTGINLTNDFSPGGFRARHIEGVFADLKKTAEVAGVPAADLGVKAFPNLRGTTGAVIGLGTGFKDMIADIKALNDVVKSESDPILNKYNESLATTNQQIARAKNAMTLASAEVEKVLAPALISCSTVVANLASRFGALDQSTRTNVISWVAFGGSALVATGVILKTIVAVSTLNTALISLGVDGIKGAIAGFGAMALPLTLLAAALTVGAFELKHFHDLAHAQEIATQAAKETAAQNVATTQTEYNHARSVASMVIQYKQMETQSIATHKPVEGMQQLLDQISTASPALVSGYDAQGHAISLMGDAAAIATQKLASMAALSRATLENQEKLEQARVGEDLNAHRRAQNAARTQMNEPTHGGMNLTPVQRAIRNQLGMPVYEASNDQTRIAAAARVRDEQNHIDELSAKYKQLQSHARTYETIPHTIESVRGTETDRLYEAYDILKDKLRQASNAYVEFHRAQKGGNDYAVRENLAISKQELKVVADELKIRHNSMLEVKNKTLPGVDPLAGLGKKPPKPKKERAGKKTDEQRQEEEYVRYMENVRQSEFINAHQGEDGERGKTAEALWETQKHGAVMYNGVLKEINGSFYDIGKTEKENLMLAARGQEFLEMRRKAAEKYRDFRKDAILNSMTNDVDATGKKASPKELEDYKLKSGFYKAYGEDASRVSDVNRIAAEQVIANAKEEIIKKWNAEVTKYGMKELSIHDQVLRSIKEDKEAYAEFEAAGAEAYATRAQHNSDMAVSVKQFGDSAQKAADDLKTLQNEATGPKTDAARIAIELQNKEYAKMAPLTKFILEAMYKRVDAQRHLNNITKEGEEAHKLMGENVADAQDRLKNAGNPKEDAYYAYKNRMLDKYTETLKTASNAEKLGINYEIRANFERVYALDEQAKKAEELYNINKQVATGIDELTHRYKINSDGLKITTEQWNKMSQAQKDNVKQLQKLATISDLGKQAVAGLGDMFAKELGNIRDHGFKHFFKDVLNMFNDMLFNMAVQWAQAQITKSLTGLLGGLLGGLSGGGGADGGGVAGAGTIGDFPSLPSGIGQAAVGGSIPSDAPTLVGERGPELFMPGRAGTIIPNNSLSGLGGGSVNVNLHVHGVQDVGTWQQSATQTQVIQTLTRSIQKVNSGGRR